LLMDKLGQVKIPFLMGQVCTKLSSILDFFCTIWNVLTFSNQSQ
jgi:hypothetical protein